MKEPNTINLFEHQAYRRLIEVSLAMSVEQNLESLLNQILDEAKSLTRSDGGTIYLKNDQGNLSFALLVNDSLGLQQSSLGLEAIELPDVPLIKGNGDLNLGNVAAAAANLGKTIVIDDVYQNESYDFQGTRLFDEMLEYRSISFLTVALKNYYGECIGVMQLLNAHDNAGKVKPFDLKKIPIIEALASLASVAIQNRQNIDRDKANLSAALHDLNHTKKTLESLETIDQTTGLHNRKYFEEVLSMECRRARRQGYEMSICFMQLDNFEQIGRDYGSDFSNTALNSLAEVVSSFLRRPSDFLALYNQSVIVALLPYLSMGEASDITEKIRQSVENRSFIASGDRVQITLSAGIATSSNFEELDESEFVQLSRKALTKAHASGGNRIEQQEDVRER
ncbi:MAG: diguanylate cyclase [Pseudomonadales bacterium]|nr:diguanylate cyclase [Pseudomonadales bacterium]